MLRAAVAAGHAGRAEGQGHHGRAASSCSDDIVVGDHRRPHRAAGRQERLHPRRLPAHGRAGRGARRACWREKGWRSTRVVELKVDEGALVRRIENADRGDAGARRAGCARTTIRRSSRPGWRPTGAQTAPLIDYYREEGHTASRRRHGADRRGDRGDRLDRQRASKALHAWRTLPAARQSRRCRAKSGVAGRPQRRVNPRNQPPASAEPSRAGKKAPNAAGRR